MKVSKKAAINRIGMAVDDNKGILGLRFLDKKKNVIEQEVWTDKDVKWTDKQFDSDYRIIGIDVNTEGEFNNLARVGWIMWEP